MLSDVSQDACLVPRMAKSSAALSLAVLIAPRPTHTHQRSALNCYSLSLQMDRNSGPPDDPPCSDIQPSQSRVLPMDTPIGHCAYCFDALDDDVRYFVRMGSIFMRYTK